jgi:predicted dehydrogenase
MNSVKWGVIGAGGIADRRTIPGMMLANNAELIAVMEVNTELAENIRAKYNAKRAYKSAEELLDDPEVQAIYIASPVVYHKKQALLAAKKGKHLLLEKPIALNLNDSKEVMDTCGNAGIIAGSGLMMRFGACHQWMRQCIRTGALGRVVSCRAQLTCWYPDIPGAWRQNKETSGGGALMDMGVHCIDLLTWIIDSPVIKVAGFAGSKVFQYEVEDSATILFETQDGAFCTVESYFNIPDDAARCRLEIYGTKGSLLAEGSISQVDGGHLEALLSNATVGYDSRQDRSIEVSSKAIVLEFGNLYTKEIEAFGNAVLHGTDAPVTLMDAYRAQVVVDAAYRSNTEGLFRRL